jgi:abequosyltransferase
MNKISLSICIPTYNFGMVIGETLKSIIDQSSDDIEVVVVDGGSTDNTKEIVLGYQQLIPRIIYHRLDAKGGIDKDLARSVELARGNYCWLMSSDDVFKSGAVQRVINEIKLGCDIYLCNRTECDRSLNPVRNPPWLLKEVEDNIFNLSTKEELINYFNKSQSIGALFSYMSSIIVRRDKWIGATYDERFTGSNFGHVFRLFSILQNGGTLKYIRDPLILCRGNNDSFLERGLFNRYLIDINGYLYLGTHLFSDNAVRRSFLDVMQREHKWYELAVMKHLAPDIAGWNALERKLIAYGYTHAQLYFVRLVTSSRFIYWVARLFWKIPKTIMLLRERITERK